MCNQFYCVFETEKWFRESYLSGLKISWIQRSQFKFVQSIQIYIFFYIFNNSTVIGHPTLTPRFHNSFCILYELRRTNVSPIRSPTDIRFNRAGKLSASPSQQGGVCLGSSEDKFIYKWHCLEAKKKIHSGSELALPRRLTTTQPGKAMLTTRRCSSHHTSVLYAQWKWRSRSQCILKLNSQLEVMAQLTSNL